MNKKIEKQLRTAFAEERHIPEPQVQKMQELVILRAKTQFLQTHSEKESFLSLLFCQMKFCGWKMWLTESLVAFGMIFLLRILWMDDYFFTPKKVFFFAMSMTVLLPMSLLPFLYQSVRYGMLEVERTSVFSIQTILISKFLLFLGAEVVLFGLLLIFLQGHFHVISSKVCLGMMIPFLATNDSFFYLLKKGNLEKLWKKYLLSGIALFCIVYFLQYVYVQMGQSLEHISVIPLAVIVGLFVFYGTYECVCMVGLG